MANDDSLKRKAITVITSLMTIIPKIIIILIIIIIITITIIIIDNLANFNKCEELTCLTSFP